MNIYLTNTLTKQKELFTPLVPGTVGMYHCGPTVYGPIHIGNLRAFLLADIVRRVFEYNYYTVNQVMNITDIGHLVSDGDDGNDKMTKGLEREGLAINLENMLSLARKYETMFVNDLSALNILTPKVLPRASDHIDQDIAIIKKLEDKGYVYTTSDGVYFDVRKMRDYGALGGINLNDEETKSRIIDRGQKRNWQDFALWKFDTDKGWQSPWGMGFPGWHIECSGMSMHYLGEQFDIHTGGHDLASIHHNNEIAQSECATGHSYVNYWLHNEFVNIGTDKMAKSGDNSITIATLTEKNIDPLALRYLYLQSHYRSQISFSWDALSGSQTALHKLQKIISSFPDGGTISESYQTLFRDMVSDDLNTAGGLAIVWELLKNGDVSDADKRATILDFDQVLGLKLSEATNTTEQEAKEIPEHIQKLIDERAEARIQKNWSRADELRDQIKGEGFEINDN